MTPRLTWIALIVGFIPSQVRADLPIAPPPREVRPDGSRDPVPNPETAVGEDPAVIVERIIANSKDAGDRLGNTDTGAETQKKQATVLKDIDTLLNQEDNSQGGGSDKDKNKDMNQDQKKDDKNPDSKKNNMPMKGMNDQPMMKEQQPMDGNDPPKEDRRPRQDQSGGKPKQKTDKQPQDMGMNTKTDDKKDPMTAGMKDDLPKEKDPKKDAAPTGGMPMGKVGIQPSLPVDDEVAKKVWGGPREQMRKQVDQYYNERFMPSYSGLLKAYYSHLAAEGAKK